MLLKSTPALAYCQRRASECERLAENSDIPDRTDFYLRLAANWLRLADQREFTDRVDIFLDHVTKDE
jgi:hypothetical protein